MNYKNIALFCTSQPKGVRSAVAKTISSTLLTNQSFLVKKNPFSFFLSYSLLRKPRRGLLCPVSDIFFFPPMEDDIEDLQTPQLFTYPFRGIRAKQVGACGAPLPKALLSPSLLRTGRIKRFFPFPSFASRAKQVGIKLCKPYLLRTACEAGRHTSKPLDSYRGKGHAVPKTMLKVNSNKQTRIAKWCDKGIILSKKRKSAFLTCCTGDATSTPANLSFQQRSVGVDDNHLFKDEDRKNTEFLWDQKRPTYPFTAIVGQEEMKLALLLNVIDPKIGGVMIMGDRGTGKSTTVRALVDLLPNIEVVDNDPFNSHPSDAELMSQNVREQVLLGKSLQVVLKRTTMIDLPLGATEDRVCGTIDIEKALSEGIKAFEPGLLAKANRGILYVDEVNLLDDHLVDILLDSAASGWNTVEREGISISHPARFILVGSGNPEEGELRPQLLDRFGMHAQIGTVREAERRVQIVEERASFDKSPVDFLNLHQEKQKELADKIIAARHLLGAVKIDYDLRVKISHVCGQLNVDGLRGDIVTNRASQALAAFESRTAVTPQDIFRVIPLCLRHRLRKDPLEPIDSGDRVREVFKQIFGFLSE